MANILTRIIDPLPDDRSRLAPGHRFTGDGRLWGVPAAIGLALLVVALIGLFHDQYQFWSAYLAGWIFSVSIALGSLFFVMFQHLTKARWVTVVRRFPEQLMNNFLLLAILGLPLFLFGMESIFHWTHSELYDPAGPHYDTILDGKAAYFFWPGEAGGFPAFFYLRMVVYFASWILVSRKLYMLSVRNDTEPGADTHALMRRVSAWGLPLVGLTTTFASFDLLMSLDPHWFSTIFGVYFFAGAIVAAIAAMTLMALTYNRMGMLRGEATVEHFHDLGKYLFGFTVFWAYMFFSQFMLIWYANIPEEVIWLQHRTTHGWQTATVFLFVFHFVLPFFLLIPRRTKRVIPLLGIMCVWMLVMHFVDLWWIIKPNLLIATGGDPAYAQVSLGWMDFALWLGFFGIFVGATMWRARRHATAPQNDPYYASSVHFLNV